MGLYSSIRKFFQPYWRPRPSDYQRPETPRRKKSGKHPLHPVDAPVGTTGELAELVKVKNSSRPLNKPWKMKSQPAPGVIWCYHDLDKHQVWARFNPGDGYRCTVRDGESRAKLRPLIYPRQGKPFDRTHLIPIGYHGSERDNRLLVGWDSQQNRNELNDFEQKQKKRKQPIFWYTEVAKMGYGARWRYAIFDARNMRVLDTLELKLECPFVWKG